jgi:hypothetical protein
MEINKRAWLLTQHYKQILEFSGSFHKIHTEYLVRYHPLGESFTYLKLTSTAIFSWDKLISSHLEIMAVQKKFHMNGMQ